MIFRRAILLAALLLFATSTVSVADALMGRYGPDQRSYSAESIKLPLALNWEHTTNKFENNPVAPVVAGNTCYFASGDRVYAIDLETGIIKWKYPADQPLGAQVRGTPALADGMVYFGSSDGNFYCISGDTGTFQWAYQTRGSIRCPPVILNGKIYFGADDNSVYAIDAGTGDAGWPSPFVAKDDFAIGIAISNDMIVAPCMDGMLYGISMAGRKRWETRLPLAPVSTSPIIVESAAAMAVGDVVYGIAVRSGQLRWTIRLPSEVATTPASDGSVIYIPCKDKNIYAYTLAGRKPILKWTQPADLGTTPMSSPVVATVPSVDSEGNAVTETVLFVTGQKGVVACFSADSGSLKWRYMIAPSPTYGSPYTDAASPPTVANGRLLVVTDDGVLHCFSPSASDNEPPVVYDMKPANASVIPAAPPLKFSAVVYDIGSGVDFSTVTMSIDGQSVDFKPEFSTSTITCSIDAGPTGKAAKRLSDGVHTVAVTAKDYVGNLLNHEWLVYADSRLQPPKRALTEDTGKRGKEPLREPTPLYNRNRGGRPSNYYQPSGMDTPPPPPVSPMPDGGGGSPTMPSVPRRGADHVPEAPVMADAD